MSPLQSITRATTASHHLSQLACPGAKRQPSEQKETQRNQQFFEVHVADFFAQRNDRRCSVCSQEPRLRRVHVRTQSAVKLDPERPEYHRVSLHWHRQGYCHSDFILYTSCSLLDQVCRAAAACLAFLPHIYCTFWGTLTGFSRQDWHHQKFKSCYRDEHPLERSPEAPQHRG